MTETLSSLIAQVKQSKYSQLSTLSEEGLANVWTHVSNFIRKQLCIQKGAGILGLGQFTFSQKLESGSKKVSRPIFMLSEKFAQLHFLKMSRQQIPGHIPVVPLNFTVISNDVPLKREIAESAVKEVILALSHSLAANRNIELELVGIGKLLIVDKKVQMKFYKDFINSLDSSGEMGKAFQRCNTASSDTSIISGPCTPRLGQGPCSLPSIKEHSSFDPASKPQATIEVGTSEDVPEPQLGREESLHTNTLKPEDPGPRPTQISRHSSRQSLCMPTASGVFYEPPGVPKAPLEGPKAPLEGSKAPLEGSKTSSTAKSTVTNLLLPSVQAPHSGQHANPHTDLPLLNTASPGSKRRTRSLSPSRHRKSTPLASGLAQQKSHTEADGSSPCQELCYICAQRAQRNVAMSFAEELRERELQENMMWQEYERQQRELHNAKEQAAKMRNARYAKDSAAFNCEVSAIQQVQRKKRSTDFYPSYVFQHRSLTPPKGVVQQKYCSELDNQVTIGRSKERERRELEATADKDYQQQLAKQLALSKEEFQREKARQRALYQKALEEQVAIRQEIGSLMTAFQGLKHVPAITSQPIPSWSSSTNKLLPLPLPKPSVRPFSNMAADKNRGTMTIQWKQGTEQEPQPLQPMFGILEPADNQRNKEKEEARALFLEQSNMAAEKQRVREEKALRAKALEAEMLMNTKKELQQDTEAALRTKEEVRKRLEKMWSESVKGKQQRLQEEHRMSEEPSILILDQCLRYKRCKQCQRRVDNMGNLRIGATV